MHLYSAFCVLLYTQSTLQSCGGVSPQPPPVCNIHLDDATAATGQQRQCAVYIYIYTQWGKKVFSQPPIVQILPLKKMREACNFHHRYTSTMKDKIRKKNPENHIVGFLKNLFANYGGKYVFGQ